MLVKLLRFVGLLIAILRNIPEKHGKGGYA